MLALRGGHDYNVPSFPDGFFSTISKSRSSRKLHLSPPWPHRSSLSTQRTHQLRQTGRDWTRAKRENERMMVIGKSTSAHLFTVPVSPTFEKARRPTSAYPSVLKSDIIATTGARADYTCSPVVVGSTRARSGSRPAIVGPPPKLHLASTLS